MTSPERADLESWLAAVKEIISNPEQLRAQTEMVFQQHDSDGNGLLDFEETKAVLH